MIDNKCQNLIELYKNLLEKKEVFDVVFEESLSTKNLKNSINTVTQLGIIRDSIKDLIRNIVDYTNLELLDSVDFSDGIFEGKDPGKVASICESLDGENMISLVNYNDSIPVMNHIYLLDKNNINKANKFITFQDIIDANKDYIASLKKQDNIFRDMSGIVSESLDGTCFIIKLRYQYILFVNKDTKKIEHLIDFGADEDTGNYCFVENDDGVIISSSHDNSIKKYDKKKKIITKIVDKFDNITTNHTVQAGRLTSLNDGGVAVYFKDSPYLFILGKDLNYVNSKFSINFFESNGFHNVSPIKMKESPDGKYLYAGGIYGFSRINKKTLMVDKIYNTIDIFEGGVPGFKSPSIEDKILDFSITEDGKYAIISYDRMLINKDKNLKILDLDTFEVVHEMPSHDGLVDLSKSSFISKSKIYGKIGAFVSCSDDGVIEVFGNKNN